MYWRIGSAYRKRPAEVNKAAFYGIVQEGPPPGLLAFDGDTAVGWCQLSSRDSLPWLDRTPNLKRVDDLPVWCISCLYVRKGYRKQGVTSALIREALNAARNVGVPALEACPLDGDLTSSSSFTGFASTFLKVGIQARCTPRASSADHASYVGEVTRVITTPALSPSIYRRFRRATRKRYRRQSRLSFLTNP